MPALPGMPQVRSSPQRHRGPGIPGTDRGDLWVPRGTAAVVTTHAQDTHLLPPEPGHRQITAQTSVQRLEPLACSGSRLENALGREPRSQQYSAQLTFSSLNAYLNKSKRYKNQKGYFTGDCDRPLPCTGCSGSLKPQRSSEVFSFLCENSRFFFFFRKINKKQENSIIMLKNATLTPNLIWLVFFKSKK